MSNSIAERNTSIPVLALVGPTAIGKTHLSIELAQKFNCEVVSVDSMQVYRYMDVGTAKITKKEMCGVDHHLIDIVNPDEEYDVAKFVRDAAAAVDSVTSRKKTALLTGGTGLYLKALMEGLAPGLPEDKSVREGLRERILKEGSSKLHEELAACDREAAERVHPNDAMRIIRGLEIYIATGIPWSAHLERSKRTSGHKIISGKSLIIGLTCDRERLYTRINKRVGSMIETGLEDEVRWLLSNGYSRELQSMGSIGYRHMANFISGDWRFDEMAELLARDTRRYAKRQYTWFGKMKGLEWHDVRDGQKVIERVERWLSTLDK